MQLHLCCQILDVLLCQGTKARGFALLGCQTLGCIENSGINIQIRALLSRTGAWMLPQECNQLLCDALMSRAHTPATALVQPKHSAPRMAVPPVPQCSLFPGLVCVSDCGLLSQNAVLPPGTVSVSAWLLNESLLVLSLSGHFQNQ